ncbi:GNAT family N-acetyltransferase [Muriicola sp. Z0-33]|uniref:GNAT family N-acetyltransferase n=1 Tax=Muriicola sp. Z0-33 TaxID=2816957 RepID=UPI002238EAFC|nr:GNAT family N-acetyltransferase [Muriicola sp. Z0-33]MCW5515390.1 GNAT family N-acetyltransferase [Muriicola sp. Z0-33]
MGNIEIRIADSSDAVAISILGRVTFTETFGHLFRDRKDLQQYLLRTFSVEKIENSLKKKENVYWIAFADRLPVGYAKLKLNSPSQFVLGDDDVCQLQKIYVLKDFLSLRIGFQLQERLLQRAIKSDYHAIWLSVLDENERAINFYKRNGFETVGQHEFQIGREHFDFIVMSKSLKSDRDS